MFWNVTGQKLEFCLCIILLLAACMSAVWEGELNKIQPVSTGVRELPIYCVKTEEKRIAITFDAAAGAWDTDVLLGILAAHNVRATFFVCGCWIRNHPDDARKIFNAGHEIGNHGDQHLDPVLLSKDVLITEIENQSAEVQKLLGIKPILYRPAYGSYNTEVIRTARELGYEAIQWSVDSLDWKEYGAEEIKQRILNHTQLTNGAILLFHNDTAYTALALDEILTGLEEKGYVIGTVSDLILDQPYEIDHNGCQYRGEEVTSSATDKHSESEEVYRGGEAENGNGGNPEGDVGTVCG